MTYETWIIRKGPAGRRPSKAKVTAYLAAMRWAGTNHADRMGAPRVARPSLWAFMLDGFYDLPVIDAATISSPRLLEGLTEGEDYYVIPADSLGRANGAPEESIRLWLKKWATFVPSSSYAIVRVPVLD